MISFTGTVVTGRGEAAGFTRLPWARDRFLSELGIDPYPGTVNLIVESGDDRAAWSALRLRAGVPVDPPDSAWCRARCYPVRLEGWLPAGVVLPDLPDYPASQVEVIAALPVRETLSLADGDSVGVETAEPLPVRAVIFDVDGTLVDSLDAFRVVAERAAAPYGLTITAALVREALTTTRGFWDLALPAGQADRAATMDALRREAARLWPAVLREHGRVFPDTASVLWTLGARGATLGIVTGSGRASLEPLRAAGLLHFFQASVTAEDVERRKPDPEGLVRCAAALGVDRHDAVYVGDTPLDIRAGRAAGMFTIGLLAGAGDSAGLSACGPDRLAASLRRVLDVLSVTTS